MSVQYPSEITLETFGLKPVWNVLRETGRPVVVTICGSTRFKEYFLMAQNILTDGGYAVFTVGGYPHAEGRGDKETSLGPDQLRSWTCCTELRSRCLN